MQHTRSPCPSPTPGVYSNSCPLSRWCHPPSRPLSSSVPFLSCLQCFPASGSYPMSQFLTSDGQRIEVSASASTLPMNIQDSFLLGWTGWISLQSKGLSRVFSNTTVQKHQFFSAQFMIKEARIYNGERQPLQKFCLKNWRATCKRIKLHKNAHYVTMSKIRNKVYNSLKSYVNSSLNFFWITSEKKK